MNQNSIRRRCFFALTLCALVGPLAHADDNQRGDAGVRGGGSNEQVAGSRARAGEQAAAARSKRDEGIRGQADRRNDRNYYFDNRFNHGRYYPRRGYAIDRLSDQAWRARHDRDDFFFDRGIWYRHSGNGFVVAGPAIGLFVPVLPPFYSTVWMGGFPYFYADDVYYRWEPRRRGYIVSEPPPERDVSTRPVADGELYMYPKNQQAQQATDRFECHRWATNESGFDPTLPLGGVPVSSTDGKRADYRRAMSACLEARGYSVK